MDFASHSRPTTAAADDVETGRLRRFPGLPLPPHGDANASPVDAALAWRREPLLRDLKKARICEDMILRELAETEHAMGFTAAGHNPVLMLPSSQDYWRCRTSFVPPLEEAPLRPPYSSTEHPPCGSRGPAAPPRVPPVYPHVEWSPSPQPRPTGDTEEQQDCMSSGARTHPFDGYVEMCRSPNKPTLVEEASVPAANEATPGHKDASGRECKDDVEDGHAVHPLYGGGNKSGGEGMAAETTLVLEDQINGPMLRSSQYRLAGQENAALDQQKGQEISMVIESRTLIQPTPEQPRLGIGVEQEQEQECMSPGAKADIFNGNVELCLSPSKRAPVEETLVLVAPKAGISPMRSALSFGKEAALGHQQAFGGEPKADVEDGPGVQPLGEIRNQSSSGQRKAVESPMEGQTDKPARPPGQHRPAGLENAAYDEQKKVEFSEAVESPMDGRTDEPAQLPGQHRPAGLENAAYNEPKKVEFSVSAPERPCSGVKRKLNAASSPIKKKKPLGKHSCTICHVNTPSQRHLEEHLAGNLHKSIVTSLQPSKNGAAELPVCEKTITATDTKSLCQDGKENAAESGGSQQGGMSHLKNSIKAKKVDRKSALYCMLCDLQCNGERMLAEHLRGKKHRKRQERSA